MPLVLSWSEISLRLLCAFASGAFIGMNRSEHGRAAGLRTSILVCVAACVAMIQVNLLLPLSGRSPNSFVMNDLMRLPLGILSGMGFIGAGAILRRGNFVVGVTTAATLWLLTVIGLCFGGGQIALGLTAAAIALVVLIGLKKVEDRMKRDLRGNLVIATADSGPDESEILSVLKADGFRISSCGFASGLGNAREEGVREFRCALLWRAPAEMGKVPNAVYELVNRAGVVRVEWMPQR